MKRLVFNVDRSFERKATIAVMAFFLIVITILVVISVDGRNRYKLWAINNTVERVQSEIHHRINLIKYTSGREIEELSKTPSLAKALKDKNTENLFVEVQPMFSRLNAIGKEKIFLGLYDSNGGMILGINDSLESKLSIEEFNTPDSKNKKQISGYDIGDRGVFHFIASPVYYLNSLVGFMRLGFRDDEFAQLLQDSLHLKICNQVIVDDSIPGLLSGKNYICTKKASTLITYGEDSLFSHFLGSDGSLETGTAKVGNRYYALFSVGHIAISKRHCNCEMFCAVDVSNFVVSFNAFIGRSILISLGFLLLLYLLLRLLFRMPLNVIQDLQQNLEKKVAERSKEIIDTNTELKQIFNSTANGLRIIDLRFGVVRVNDSFCKLYSVSREDVDSKKCYDSFACKFCHTADCSLERIKNGAKKVEFEEVKVLSDGRRIKCFHTVVPFLGEHEELLGIIEDVKDVTEKMVMEDTLLRTEEQQDTFLNNLTVGVFIKSIDQTMLYQNDTMDNLFGSIRHGEKMGSYITEKTKQKWRLEDESVLAEGSLSVEEKMVDRFGNERTFLTQKFRFTAADGSIRIGGIMIDTTTKVEAEKRLRIMSKAINASPLSLVISTTAGVIEQVNPAFSDLTGYSCDEALGLSVSTCVFPGQDRLLQKEIFPLVLGGSTWKGEFICPKKTGEDIWVSAIISPVRDRHENIRYILIQSEDISFRKEYERELRKAKEKAEESDRLKMAFLANISHEIRTPLNAIVGFNNLLASSDEISPEERLRLVKIINQNSSQLLRIIENTIDISKFETEQFKLLMRPCNLNDLMEELFHEVFEQGLVSNSVKLSIRKELAQSGLTILTDGFRLKQVIENLLTNSLKHTANGFVEFGYTLRDPNTLLFYVVDSGVGIPEDRQETIFQPFTPGASRTNESGGLGVGLPLTKKVLSCLGGEIWFKSSMGSGSSFYFTIPLVIVDAKFSVDKYHQGVNYPAWIGKQVLIADDLEENFYLLKAALKNTKATILWAKDGFQAVSIFKNNPQIDIVLMDLRMPGMDGYQATEEIKAINHEVPIICQTAYADTVEKEKISSSGFDALFTKPIALTQIINEMDLLLKN